MLTVIEFEPLVGCALVEPSLKVRPAGLVVEEGLELVDWPEFRAYQPRVAVAIDRTIVLFLK